MLQRTVRGSVDFLSFRVYAIRTSKSYTQEFKRFLHTYISTIDRSKNEIEFVKNILFENDSATCFPFSSSRVFRMLKSVYVGKHLNSCDRTVSVWLKIRICRNQLTVTSYHVSINFRSDRAVGYRRDFN